MIQQVESGFSIQDAQLVENLAEETMIAKRRVIDAIENYENIPALVTYKMLRVSGTFCSDFVVLITIC
jgi:hypothetical protein